MARLGFAVGFLLLAAMAQAGDTASVAGAFLRTLMVEMDLPRAYREYADPNFREHNPEIGNGYEAKIAYFADRLARNPNAPAAASWANVVDHVIVSNDLFAVHRHVFMSAEDRGRVFVDIWRVAGGKIVEHWDIIEPVPERTLGSITMWCGLGSSYSAARALPATLQRPSCGAPDPGANGAKSAALVRRYVQMMSHGERSRAALRFQDANYIEHGPDVDDELTGVVVRILVQGDLVLVHRHITRPRDQGDRVAADIFRIAGNRIVEHWDVKQAVPATSANGNTVW
jgi:predicted SnoaL-like aldol condensation-catalyzing enzyme